MHFTFDQISDAESEFRKNLINSVTGFKSLSLIGTINPSGQTNLCVVSQVVHVGATPPLIGVLFRPHTVPRHSLENILDNRYYTLNHVNASFVKAAHHTAARWSGSEFEACGLHEDYQPGFRAPFVLESKIKLGLEFQERLDVQSNGTHFIIGRILHLMVEDRVVQADGFIDLEAAGTLTVSGLDSYHKTQKITRFTYPKPNQDPQQF